MRYPGSALPEAVVPNQRRRATSAASRRVERVAVIVAALAVAVTLILVSRGSANARRRLAEAQVELEAERMGSHLSSYLTDRMTDVRTVALTHAAQLEADYAIFPELPVHETGSAGGLRAFNFIDESGRIRVTVPETGNEAALGRNVGDHPQAGPFFRRAQESGRDTLTPPLELYQGKRGFVGYFPVNNDGARIGYLNAVFEISALIDDVGWSHQGDLHVRITDGDDLVYQTGGPATSAGLTSTTQVPILDRSWSVEVSATPEYARLLLGPRLEPWLIIGLTADVLLAGLALWWIRGREREDRLTEQLARMGHLVEASTDLHAIVDTSGAVQSLNPAGRALLGLDGDPCPALADWLEPGSDPSMHEIISEARREGHWEGELRLMDRSKRLRPALFRLASLSATPDLLAVSATDLTERSEIQKRLILAQQMEALGDMAGSIAHDFNNLLTVVLAAGDALVANPDASPQIRDRLRAILLAGERGAELTTNLLAFANRTVVGPVPLDVAVRVHDLQPLLRTLVGERIELTVDTPISTGLTLMEAGRLEQIIVNIVVNATHAMPTGGRLTVTVRPAGADRVALVVQDDGTGMSPQVLSRATEAFYTTKGPRGTGLGLATVNRFVTEAGGTLELRSEEGVGTTVRIEIPLVEGSLPEQAPAITAPPARSGRVLLVEDNELVRSTARRILTTHGYEIVEAVDGVDGLERLDASAPGSLVALVTDVVMPRLDGPELARRARERHPDLGIVLASGYTEILGAGDLDEIAAVFLPKPYRPDALLRAVGESSDRARRAARR